MPNLDNGVSVLHSSAGLASSTALPVPSAGRRRSRSPTPCRATMTPGDRMSLMLTPALFSAPFPTSLARTCEVTVPAQNVTTDAPELLLSSDTSTQRSRSPARIRTLERLLPHLRVLLTLASRPTAMDQSGQSRRSVFRRWCRLY